MNQHYEHNSSADGIGKLAISATLHCLTGCVIGETIGLMIGVALQWHPLQTALTATALAFVTGFALTLFPAFKRGLSLTETFKAVWLGETISIGTMEVVMNLIDYQMGGMNAASVTTTIFWVSLTTAVVAGFAAGYPINYWMLKHNIKQKCH